MVSTNEIKNGMAIEFEGNLYTILEFLHVKPGKGGAFVRTKLKNLRTGATIDYTFNADVKVKKAMIDKVKMSYLYNDGANVVMMDPETYEQIEIPNDRLAQELNYMMDGNEFEVVSYEGEILGINLPDKVTLSIVECDPAVKGDTKTNALKDAKLETGLMVKVPLFVENGTRVIIDTRTGEYDGREQ